MGLLLTLILLFLVAGVGTAVRQHGWAQGVRRYGAGLAGLGAGAAQAVGFAGDAPRNSQDAGESDPDSEFVEGPTGIDGRAGSELEVYALQNSSRELDPSHPYHGYVRGLEPLETQFAMSQYELLETDEDR